MDSQGRMRELVLEFTKDPDWLPSVTTDITDAIHLELADVDADPELRSSTYASTDSVLRLIVDLTRSRRSPREAVPPPAAVDYAWEFVRRGLPLDSLLRAYHIGQATFFRRWSEKARADIDDPDELARAIELGADWTFEYVEALSGELVRGYGEERERWVRSAAAVRAQVVDSVLGGETIDVEQASRRLGYELEQTNRAVVFWSEDGRERLDTALATLERAASQFLGSLGAGTPLLVPRARLCLAGWIGWRGEGETMDLASAHLDLQAFPTVLAAFGSAAYGVAGFARSHREAMYARRIARLTEQRPGSVTSYENVALAALASADVDQAREFVAAELGPLVIDDDYSRRLCATLRIYLEENLSPSRAARRLGVHEHTITNRIRAAQELLPHPIEQRVSELQVALRLIRLAQRPLEVS
jgi:hypothetical protein